MENRSSQSSKPKKRLLLDENGEPIRIKKKRSPTDENGVPIKRKRPPTDENGQPVRKKRPPA
ncbi:MAG: hypothetical protein LUC97_09325, partial [Clostridiales bacterium]|nr:hypothetical protein [Clostridiales bacterium]